MQFDKGYISAIHDNPTRSRPIIEDAYILIHEKKISSLRT